jgi:predicted DNA-binding transcriptional regulator AlpA
MLMKSQTAHELLTQDEAADFLRLSPRTLERYRVTGCGPIYVKLGGRVVYRPSDLEEWIAARVRHSTSEARS